MATSVGLNFRLTAAVDKFEAGMRDVEKRLNGIERSSKQTASGMKLLAGIEVGKLLVGGLTKVFSIMSSAIPTVTNFANATRDVYDKVGKLSAQTGMAAEPLQVLQQISKYAGLELDSFRSAAQKMSRSLGDAANGTGTAGKAIERMGLDLNQLLKMSPSQQFITLGEAIASIKDPATRSAEAANVFGRNGMIMIPMFKDLAKNAKETAEEMLELGQILSGTQVSNIEAMNDSFEKVKKTAFAIGSQVVANFAPALTAANDALIEMVKNFEYEGATGGQGVAKLLTDGLFAGARAMAESLDAFLGGFDTTTGVMQTALAKLITAFEIVSAPFIGADAAARLGAFAQQLEGAAQRTKSVDVSFVDLVDRAKKLYENATSAADGVAGLTKEVQSTPSKLQLLSKQAEASSSAVGRLEQAAPGFVSKAVEFGGKLFDAGKSVSTWGKQVLDQSAAGKDLAHEHRGLVRSGVVTQDALDALAFAASGTGSSALDAKLKLYDLADSAKQLQAVQDRLKSKFMSPFEEFANNRQQILEAMGFNPFYVEEQKRIWLEKQQNAVDKQIEQAKDAYMKFKERMGESIELGLEDLNLDLEETLPELQEQTGILTGIKQIFDNAAPLLSFQF
ncbi:MAG: hypothetical protein ACO3LT_06870 [Ilumatobacteraceae bacterium]